MMQKITLTDAPVFQVENIQANLDGNIVGLSVVWVLKFSNRFSTGSLIVLSGPQGVAYVELPSNLPSLEAKQQGPSVKSARYVACYKEIIQVNPSINLP